MPEKRIISLHSLDCIAGIFKPGPWQVQPHPHHLGLPWNERTCWNHTCAGAKGAQPVKLQFSTSSKKWHQMQSRNAQQTGKFGVGVCGVRQGCFHTPLRLVSHQLGTHHVVLTQKDVNKMQQNDNVTQHANLVQCAIMCLCGPWAISGRVQPCPVLVFRFGSSTCTSSQPFSNRTFNAWLTSNRNPK